MDSVARTPKELKELEAFHRDPMRVPIPEKCFWPIRFIDFEASKKELNQKPNGPNL